MGGVREFDPGAGGGVGGGGCGDSNRNGPMERAAKKKES